MYWNVSGTSKLSSSGSDSDADMKDVQEYYPVPTAADGQAEAQFVASYDDNAQDYSYSEAVAEGNIENLFMLHIATIFLPPANEATES